jgi:uncharacterized phiE125 gp8 family phage protein
MLERLAATNEPAVTLDDAKAHLRVDHDAEDDAITVLLQAAIDTCGDEAGRAFDRAPYLYSDGCWPHCGYIDLPLAPVQSVDAVEYVDENGATIALEPETWNWQRTSQGARVRLDPDFDLPDLATDFQAEGRQVRVTFTAGYLPPSEVQDDSPGDLRLPSQARAAVLLTLGHFYANREAVVVGKTAVPLPIGARHLLGQIKLYR